MSAAGDDRADRFEVAGLACAAGVRTLFDHVSFSLDRGRWIGLVGPNGSGKSTLLRALAGLGRPVAGSIRWRGRAIDDPATDWHAAMAYQGHLPGFKDGLGALENLRWQLLLDGVPADGDALRRSLDRVGLARQARLPYQRLSAGQRRRLALARLHALRRPVWLLDEPSTALDADGIQLFGELLDAHLAGGGLAVCATHHPLPTSRPPLPLELGAISAP